MKKLVAFVLLLALTVNIAAAMSEGLNLDMWKQYQVSIKQINNTNYVNITEKFTH